MILELFFSTLKIGVAVLLGVFIYEALGSGVIGLVAGLAVTLVTVGALFGEGDG